MWHDDAPPPADPWAGVGAPEPTLTFATTPALPVEQTLADARRQFTRPLYGAVYCCQTATDPDKYVGKAGPRVGHSGRRSPCSPGRRIDEHRDRQPWGHEMLPGKRGYRVLEWVEQSGHGAEYDEANLRYREALWIQWVNPTENAVRPVPVPPEIALQRRAARPDRRAPVPQRRQFASARLITFLVLSACYAAVVAWLAARALGEVWPWLPWVAAPVVGPMMGWVSLWEMRRRWDALTRPSARPPAPRRRRRSRR